MTPEEHRLTLRLLDIVEPFVGASPANKDLITQPNEILDEIAFHIESKRDLLSFALTCERMYRVIHPRHYEYRVIRAKISSLAVWQHLIDNKALARGVRRLEVLDDRSRLQEIVPSCISREQNNHSDLDFRRQQEALLIHAIHTLPTLTNFVWDCHHSLMPMEVVWDALVLCDNLKDVEILDNLVFNNPSDGYNRGQNASSNASLRSIAIRSSKSSYGSTRNPSLQRVSDMLIDRCPNLEDLKIGYDAFRHCSKPKIDDLVAHGRWLSLRRLTLRSFWCSAHSGIEAIAMFLSEHVNLEVLDLDIGRHAGSALVLPPHSLPRLRELTANKELATAIMASPFGTGYEKLSRPLEIIKGVSLSGSGFDQPFFNALKQYEIKRLELVRFNDIDDIRRLVECVPKLTWLDVGMRCNFNKLGPMTIPNAGEWAMMLSQLPELVAFHGIRVFYDSLPPEKEGQAITHSDLSRVVKNNETANVFAWKVPKLRRLDHWEDGSGKIVVLVREGKKVSWEVRRVKG